MHFPRSQGEKFDFYMQVCVYSSKKIKCSNWYFYWVLVFVAENCKLEIQMVVFYDGDFTRWLKAEIQELFDNWFELQTAQAAAILEKKFLTSTVNYKSTRRQLEQSCRVCGLLDDWKKKRWRLGTALRKTSIKTSRSLANRLLRKTV